MKQDVRVSDAKGKGRKMVYRTLGKTGLKLPVINMGVMLTDNPNLIRKALDSGILLLDTAHGYMQGHCQSCAGRYRNRRHESGQGISQQPPTVKNIPAPFKWMLQYPNVHKVIAGFTTFEHIETDLSIMEDLTLTEPEKIELQKEAFVRGSCCQGADNVWDNAWKNFPSLILCGLTCMLTTTEARHMLRT